MDDSQEQHLQRIKTGFIQQVDAKFRAGAHEHHGDLQYLSALSILDNAIEETIDNYVYLMTLREKLKAALK